MLCRSIIDDCFDDFPRRSKSFEFGSRCIPYPSLLSIIQVNSIAIQVIPIHSSHIHYNSLNIGNVSTSSTIEPNGAVNTPDFTLNPVFD